ncbi:IS3 family transposase [Streptomyces humi]|uniref:IS3 family transposase n=1 Tax=Streptomyces humi TaxID=1428620 RepID=UPI003B84784B
MSPSTYFARKKRPKPARRLRDEQLMPLIEEIHAEPGRTYGARRITRALRRKGHEVARCTVERLMAELGPEGVIRGRRRRTTVPKPSAPWSPDLADRVGAPIGRRRPAEPTDVSGAAGRHAARSRRSCCRPG